MAANASKFKVGDRVRVNSTFSGAAKAGATATVTGNRDAENWVVVEWSRDGLDNGQRDGCYFPDTFDLVAPATSGPIRTVTRREIVPGTYGVVSVDGAYSHEVSISLTTICGPDDLREAAHIFNQIAEVLEEQEAA